MKKAEKERCLRRFLQWARKHYKPSKCEFCDYVHKGYHEYRTHLIEAHPEENEKFNKWAGLK